MAFDAAAGGGGGGVRRGKASAPSPVLTSGPAAGHSGAVVANPAFGAGRGATTGASAPNVASYQGSSYASVCERTEDDLKKLSTVAAGLRKQQEALGTRSDDHDLRMKINANVKRGRELVSALKVLLTDFPQLLSQSGLSTKEVAERKAQYTRFTSDYKAIAEQFATAAQAAAAAERKYPVPSNTAAGSKGVGKPGASGVALHPRGGKEVDDEAVMAQLQHINLTESLIAEREDAIDNIASAVQEVNDAFKDIAGLVEEQGRGLIVIEKNTADAVVHTEAGVGHLTQAAKYQKGYRRCLIIFVVIIILIGGALTAYFLITNKK